MTTQFQQTGILNSNFQEEQDNSHLQVKSQHICKMPSQSNMLGKDKKEIKKNVKLNISLKNMCSEQEPSILEISLAQPSGKILSQGSSKCNIQHKSILSSKLIAKNHDAIVESSESIEKSLKIVKNHIKSSKGIQFNNKTDVFVYRSENKMKSNGRKKNLKNNSKADEQCCQLI